MQIRHSCMLVSKICLAPVSMDNDGKFWLYKIVFLALSIGKRVFETKNPLLTIFQRKELFNNTRKNCSKIDHLSRTVWNKQKVF